MQDKRKMSVIDAVRGKDQHGCKKKKFNMDARTGKGQHTYYKRKGKVHHGCKKSKMSTSMQEMDDIFVENG